ncbi:Legionella pneumophila major outer membrane protein precursor [Legionella massiliensis]|uniref:Legionella pneumophila major outer membrane protein n=1 Tax=Legionella massiliensis TaxID=1034943 RepID=A0A078KWI1_9GAMM|nr:Lpg1974 family pore-forming outer membrane protein [Legionella massiliensis]CDZ76053.1 Legionella pneumophila major outer membrane protein precursor [Legionella massiliensis]CEE11791.1 Legionella pneumophila major outer membrane protein precursor [Legionella massiliensis]
MLKKTTLAIRNLAVSGFASAVAVFGLSSSAVFAGTMGPVCTPGNVTVPCEERKWDLGVQALYLQPTYTTAKGYESRFVDLRPNFNYKSTQPDWGWGYRIEGSYHFHTGNDITMTLMHYDIDSDIGGFIGSTRFARTSVPYGIHEENKFDQVNLVLGQHVDMGEWKKARFYGGLQYAKIRVDIANNYRAVPTALLAQGVLGFEQYRNSDVDGVGPVVGIDYSYDLVKGFSVTANTASSLLYGTTRYSEGYVFAPSGLIQFHSTRSRKVVVPSLEAKLGLKYVHECAQGTLNIEGGFQALNYFQAFESRGQVGFGAGTFNNDFGLYGPYFGAKWVGNV